MVKKSNKTEHVLRLITKIDETEQGEDLFAVDLEPAQNDSPTAQAIIQPLIQQTVQPVEQPEIPEIAAQPPEVDVPEPQEPVTLRAFREQEAAGGTVPESDDDLVNLAELLAKEKVRLVMDRMKVCSCKTCVNDVLALALNALPTKYVTTSAGKQLFHRDSYKKEYETDILAALTKACVRVKASPRH